MRKKKLRHQLAGHHSHRFGPSSETIEQLQLALEASEIAVAKMTAKLRLPGGEPKDKPERRPIPGHIPRQEIELTTGGDDCARCGGRLRRLGEDGEPMSAMARQMGERGTGVCARPVHREPDRAAALCVFRL